MLSFKYRFHGRNSLRYIYKNGDTYRNQFFTLRFTHQPNRTTPRIAIVVSRKTAKRAVARNHIRRRMYELFRLELPKLAPTSNIACIIHLAEIDTLSHADLEKLLQSSLRQANLYKSP